LKFVAVTNLPANAAAIGGDFFKSEIVSAS
jgi:hypothetical protein